MTPERVRELTGEWMERRPLRLLADCRLAHVDRLFEGLRACGKQVAVLSDYPAADKLQAMGLQAHPVICATDPEIARLKPDPSGLRAILSRTGVSAGSCADGGGSLRPGRRGGQARWRAGADPLAQTASTGADLPALRRPRVPSRAVAGSIAVRGRVR